MRKMKKIVAALLTGTMLATIFTSCGASTDSSGTATGGNASTDGTVVKIGSVHPLTGSYAYEAQQIINSQQLAIDEIYAAGGISSM